MSKKIGLESQYAKLYPVKANLGKLIVTGIAKAVQGIKKPSALENMKLGLSETPSTARRAMSKKSVEMLTVKPTIKGKPVGEGTKGAAVGTAGTGLGYYDTIINETDVESKMGGGMMNYSEGGFPDLNNDGKTTFADVLKGRLKGKKKNSGKRSGPPPKRGPNPQGI
jgi:hypothetical protein